jgi:hypothetical protein
MRPPVDFYRCILGVLLLLMLMQGVSGWTVRNMSVTPGQEPVVPQAPVRVTYSVHFDSFLTGLTFPSKNTLDMYTDLANAQWVVTKTEIAEEQPPVTTPIVEKKGPRVRIDGWILSYARKQFDLNVLLQGVAADVQQPQDTTIIRVSEYTADGKPLSDTSISKKYLIYVPTPTPETPTHALTQTPADIIRTQNTVVTMVTPTRKQTYTPGPGPLVICGMLSFIVIIIAMKRELE